MGDPTSYLFGHPTTLGVGATRLSDIETPMCMLTIRSRHGSGEIRIGGPDLSGGRYVSFIMAGEAKHFGPYHEGRGLRPCDIYVIGQAGEQVVWDGLAA